MSSRTFPSASWNDPELTGRAIVALMIAGSSRSEPWFCASPPTRPRSSAPAPTACKTMPGRVRVQTLHSQAFRDGRSQALIAANEQSTNSHASFEFEQR